MAAEFDEGGIRFQYPENWRLEREETEDGWTITVQSPQTAFALITVNAELPSTEAMLQAALKALQEEYEDLEIEECAESMAGQPAIGHDIRFTSLDLTNTCWTRSFYGGPGTIMVLCQCSDLESDVNEPVLRAICSSLAVED